MTAITKTKIQTEYDDKNNDLTNKIQTYFVYGKYKTADINDTELYYELIKPIYFDLGQFK